MNTNYYISSNANVVDTMGIDYVYDERLPESLEKLNAEDVLNNPLISTDSIQYMCNTLSSLLRQIPTINPPTFIPAQTLILKDEMDNLISSINNKNTKDAATSTSMDLVTPNNSNNKI